MGKPHLNRCIHNRALRVGLFLCQGSSKCQAHLCLIIQSVDMLSFEEDLNGRSHSREHTNNTDAIHNITSKSGHALRNNKVNLPRLTVCNHSVERVTFFQ